MEIDSRLEVVDVAKPISHLFNTLDFGVDAFTDRVGNAMATVSEDVFDMDGERWGTVGTVGTVWERCLS